MEQAYLKDRLAAHGVDTIVPSSPSDRQRVFSAIMVSGWVGVQCAS